MSFRISSLCNFLKEFQKNRCQLSILLCVLIAFSLLCVNLLQILLCVSHKILIQQSIYIYTRIFPDNSVRSVCLQHRRPLFYSWVQKIRWRRDRLPTPAFLASLVPQLVKNPLAMWETWVQSLGWEDPLEKEKVTHSIILAQRIP